MAMPDAYDPEEYRKNHIPRPWQEWEVWRENFSGFHGKDRIKFVGGFVKAYDLEGHEKAVQAQEFKGNPYK